MNHSYLQLALFHVLSQKVHLLPKYSKDDTHPSHSIAHVLLNAPAILLEHSWVTTEKELFTTKDV